MSRTDSAPLQRNNDATAGMPVFSRRALAGLALGLVAAVYLAGAPGLVAPWIIGDEFIFIARNPDVNPVAAADGAAAPPLWTILTKIHDDLYQPLPILSYALQWGLTGGETGGFRRVDLLIHIVNALLLWRVLTALLARCGPTGFQPVPIIAWALALLWALHPVHVTTYASDMGRTHLLSATFALLALASYHRTLATRDGGYFLAALAALLAAMLSKPIPGWVLLAVTLEAMHGGWRRAALSPRVWVVAVVCAGFGLLALWTSRQAGLIADASKGLFGDPLARSAWAVWLYFRNLVAPLWLAFWYLPDPRTSWTHPLTWIGLLLAGASACHAVRSWRSRETRLTALGWAWCWGLLLPVIGLVGAREVAAVDRYVYQPLMGITLVAGVVAIRAVARFKPAHAARVTVATATALGLIMMLWDMPQSRIARSTVGRAARLVELNAGDPRALEALAAAYDFARNHPLSADDRARVPPGSSQPDYFTARLLETLTRAANANDLPHYFPGPADRAPFHRRLAYRFLAAGSPEQSLAQAEEARRLQPNEFMTWRRLAHAYQALRRLDEAAAAYERCEELLPDRPDTRAAHFTDYGSLLLFDLERDVEACPKFAAVFEAGMRPLQAKLGLALCEIRYGEGARGFALVREVLATDPTITQAWLVAGEYHLRSHNWPQARAAYEAVVREHPTHYAALRGYHEACLHIGRPLDAALAWGDALAQEPGRREFRSYLVWALALAGDRSTQPAAEALLRDDPDNPLACFAQMIEALRDGRVEEAVGWVTHAAAGEPLPKAREFERAAASLEVLMERKALPADAALAQAAIYLNSRFPRWGRERAAGVLGDYVAKQPDSRYLELARRFRAQLSDHESAP